MVKVYFYLDVETESETDRDISAEHKKDEYAKIELTLHFPPPPILPGDINGDYVINISDAILLLKVLAGTSPPQTRIFLEADVNGDGQLGLAEALFVLKKVAH
jgi:hypothetical protein